MKHIKIFEKYSKKDLERGEDDKKTKEVFENMIKEIING